MVPHLVPRRYRPGALGTMGGSCLALTVLLTLAVVAGEDTMLSRVGLPWQDFVESHRSQFWLQLSLLLDLLGYTGAYVYMGVLVVVLLWRGYRRYALFAAASALIVLLVSRTMTVLIGRPRPADGLLDPASAAFPSGHSTATVAAVVITGFLLARTWVWILGACVAVLVMLSRTFLQVHWLGDTVAGFFLAAGIVTLLWIACQPKPTGPHQGPWPRPPRLTP